MPVYSDLVFLFLRICRLSLYVIPRNLSEETTSTTEQLKAFSDWLKDIDPYDHIVVVHTGLGRHNTVYNPLQGYPSFDGASLQSLPLNVHNDTRARVSGSALAGKPWIVANDEQGPGSTGVAPDGFDVEQANIREHALYGNLFAGGAGVEYYFGYSYTCTDITCQDWRSRHNMWVQSKHALDFFYVNNIPFQNMRNENSRVSGENWCLVDAVTPVVLVYLRDGITASINLSGLGNGSGSLSVWWYNPRTGGSLQSGASLTLGTTISQSLGDAPGAVDNDWIILLR